MTKRLYDVRDVDAAVALAERWKKEGRCDLFRGQLHGWPIRTTLARLAPKKRADALVAVQRFLRWSSTAPGVKEEVVDDDQALAIAQHYGFPTTFVDITTEPRVAGFFAADGKHRAFRDERRSSRIYAFDSTALPTLAKRFRPAVAEWSMPRIVRPAVRNLWRLEAQYGQFLDVDWDTFGRNDDCIAEALRMHVIVFPYRGPFSGIERSRIYPERRSQLEILLQEYGGGDEKLYRPGPTVGELLGITDQPESHGPRSLAVTLRSEPLHDEELRALPRHSSSSRPSWIEARRSKWIRQANESFHGAVTTREEIITFDSYADPFAVLDKVAAHVRKLCDDELDLRSRLVNWRAQGPSEKPLIVRRGKNEGGRFDVSQRLDQVWDGMRMLPYSNAQVAHAMARTLVLHVLESQEPEWQGWKRVGEVFGPYRAIDIGFDDHLGIVVNVNDGALFSALSGKPVSNEEAQERVLERMNPAQCTEFDDLVTLFADELVANQVFQRGAGHLICFSPARLTVIGPH